ncbi:MAG: hypothetical protein Q9223_002590 [Gallowayella weberi]
MADLDEFVLYGLQISINYAAQLGASLLFLIVLLLLTKPDKRSSPIFIINIVALTLNFLRNLLQCLYYTGPFSETYAYFAADYSRVSASDFANQIAITVLNFLLLVCVETSLLLQVRVVCVTARRVYRQMIFGVSGLVAGLAIGFRLAFCIMNAKYILSLAQVQPLGQLASATNITTSISISIFSIIEYVVDLPSMDSNVLTLVSIFLPLSSLWASSSLDHRQKPTAKPKYHDGRFFGNDNTASTGPLVDETFLIVPVSPAKTTTSTKNTTDEHDLDDLEAQKSDER